MIGRVDMLNTFPRGQTFLQLPKHFGHVQGVFHTHRHFSRIPFLSHIQTFCHTNPNICSQAPTFVTSPIIFTTSGMLRNLIHPLRGDVPKNLYGGTDVSRSFESGGALPKCLFFPALRTEEPGNSEKVQTLGGCSFSWAGANFD